MINKHTQALLLLCCHFSKAKKNEPKPLTPTEFKRFSEWLFEKRLMPGSLIDDFENVVDEWKDPKGKIEPKRLKYLLGRGLEMSISLEKWTNASIWIMHKKDPDYPKSLMNKLKGSEPSIIFGIGNKKLLNIGGLAIVGSRNIDKNDEKFTKSISRKIAFEGKNIVSGGARGVDEIAMLSALEVDGTAVGVLADSLLNKSISKKWRKYIKNNNLVLVSTFYPDAGFNVGNAMARNKFVYCLSDAALVVQSGPKGGTISGAMENLKKDWTTLWVKKTDDNNSGNALIIEAGGHWCESNVEKIDPKSLFISQKKSVKTKKTKKQIEMF
jgi:predicted Rossmann fold nucleotide-binding protein DprA/Smf involved in DNA uptake